VRRAAPQVKVRAAALSQRKVEGVEGGLPRGWRRGRGAEVQADVRDVCGVCGDVKVIAWRGGVGRTAQSLRSPLACAASAGGSPGALSCLTSDVGSRCAG
jgi:hypothetical protein